MWSEKASAHANACRFCWMCRHLCPVGQQTGKEANTPRAKGLLVSMEQRGFPFDRDTAQVMYECMLCGACTNDCATGYDPPLYIREARTQAVVMDLVPKSVQTVLDHLIKTGNMFGLDPNTKFDALKEEFEGVPEKADVLLYIGDAAAFKTPDMAVSVIGLLKKAGIDFAVLRKEPNAGTDLSDLMGFVAEAQVQAKACADAINASGAKTVVVLDPYNAVTMKHEYPAWGCPVNAEVVTATAYIASLVKEGKLNPKKGEGTVTYHDSSRHARDLDEHEPARYLIASLGLVLKEMFLNRRLSKCCGSALFRTYTPDLCRLTSRGRWADAMRTEVRTLVTACPEAYWVLREETPEGYAAKDVFTLLLDSCK